MITDDDRVALTALIDGELDVAHANTLEARVAADPALRAVRDEIAATRDAVARLPRPELPPGFRDRISALADAPEGPAAREWLDGWRSVAAAVVVTALITSSATWFVAHPTAPSLETLVASAHHRSLLATTPVDVLSSDRHTVKPWLDSRLGVSPPAPDLAASGYPLLGGRVDVVGQQAVPTLVYRHNEHTISLIAVPGTSGTVAAHSFASGGYNMIEWKSAGFNFIAVSDLEADELTTFATGYRGAAGR
jgi:anti-sigma factor RsiW